MEATDSMEYPDPKLEKEKSVIEGDASADRSLSASTTEASTREERDSLLTLARSGFVRSDTTIGADGKIDIPPIFPTLTTAASLLESKQKQKNDVLAARPSDATARPAHANADIAGQRSRLTELASRSMTPVQFKRFSDQMKAFETRAQERGLSDKEVASTYRHASRLLADKATTPLSAEQRRSLARQIVESAADPTDISQGTNSTCTVASVETTVYTINPSDAARMVADVALTGKYISRDGREIVIDPTPRTAAARITGPRLDGQRVHASEIFHITATNLFYQSEGLPRRYDQREPADGSSSGERLIDTKTGKTVDDYPGLRDTDLVTLGRLITGHRRISVIHSREFGKGEGHGLVDVASTAQELDNLLLRAREERRLPVIVAINSRLEPIASYGDDLSPARLGRAGGHEVTITDYHPGPPASVSMDNQWEKAADFLGSRRLSVEDLWKVMHFGRHALPIAQQQVDRIRAEGRFDPDREAELLRLQATHGNLGTESILAATQRFWERFSEHCRKESTCTPADIKVREAAYRRLFAALPPL